MDARKRFLIAIAVLGLLMTGPFLVTAGILFLDLKDAERELLTRVLLPRLPIGTLMTGIGFVIGVQVLRQLFRQYVRGLRQMAEHLRLMHSANRGFRIKPSGPPEVKELANAANALAQQRDELLIDVERQVSDAKASVEEEKNRLGALMSQLAMGVIVCNREGRILLYNSRARLQFKALSQGRTSTSLSSGTLIGLGRSIRAVLEPAQIEHAVATIEQRLRRGSAEVVANFVTTSRMGQLLRTQVTPVLDESGIISGYVLTLENITRAFERDSQRDQALNALAEESRASLGNMSAAAETLLDDGSMPAAVRERLLRVITEEAASLSQRMDKTMRDFADSLRTRWPLEEVLGMDLIAAATQRIESKLSLLTKIEEQDERLWVRADSFSLIQAISFLASRLQDNYDIRELRFRLRADGATAHFDLIWSGPPVSSETFFGWEMDSMSGDGDTSPLTLRDVMNRHGGEVWYQREATSHSAFIRLAIPLATPPEETEAPDTTYHGRAVEFYDFNLFNYTSPGIDLDRKLSELSYTVFDTETTGLNPAGGDEIIQIGAMRIVNGRLLQQEAFVQLVDPEIPIKPEGIPIHGITDDMVRGKPRIGSVLPAFHEFCAETVLVAHNGAFDMRFLQMKEASTGIRFTQPVLDTLLLSAVIHPGQDSHSLEEIAARLGVTIQGRHSALGDAQVTGEIFLKMLPLLADQGIHTLGQAIEAAEKTYYASIKY